MWKGLVAIGLAGCLTVGGAAAYPAAAEQTATGTPVYDREKLEALYRKLGAARNPGEAQKLSDRIWRLWTEGPDARAGEQIQQIFRHRRQRELDRALEIANDLIERLPAYAEGWNQKATILFEMGRFDESLEVIEKVLAREPRHFGALAGKAMILLRQGRVKLGQKALRRAVEIHPFLAERRFLLEPPGQPI